MKNLFTALLMVCMLCTADAQNFKFGKVSKEELKESAHPKDTSANAAVLYRNHKVYYNYRENQGFLQTTEVHERIKIYNKEGFDWATRREKLFNKDNSTDENLYGLKAYTYNLVDGKITEDKLDKKEIFEEIANKYWKYKSFTMPNIQEGCVIEFTYRIESPFIQIDDIGMQYEIPINFQEIRVSTPEYFVYNKMLNPRAQYIPKLVTARENVSVPISYFENIVSSEMTDVPALKDEPMVDNIDNYRAKLIMELALTRFPNSPTDTYSTSWEKVTENIYKNSGFGMEIDKTSYYKDDVDALIGSVSDPAKKMELIYNFVKSKVKWNNYYGLYSDEGTRRAYKEGTGNSGDINLMLISMMRYAGLNANPVLVSTKNNGIPLFPTREGFNYVICLVEAANFNALLDGTDEFSSINILPIRVMNWQGRLVRKDGSSDWISLSPNFTSKDVISMNAEIKDDLVVEGKVRNQLTNHFAMRHRNKYAHVNKDEYRKQVEKDKGQLEVSDLEITNLMEPIQPITLTYTYKSSDRVEQIGDKIYLSPLLFLANSDNPFKQESRKYPIDLSHPISDKYMVNIKLPEGYEVDTLPKNEKYQFNGEEGEYTYLIKDNGNSVQLTVSLNINIPLILAGDYEYFRNFYTLMLNKQAEQLVLKKI